MIQEDEHIIEAIGKARVTVRNGEVVDVTSPLIEKCPLARRFSVPVEIATPEAIKANIQERIHNFGMCTKNRQVILNRDFVLFGASELISCAISRDLIDCAVIVCDGAGTLMSSSAEMVQGIGGRMSGLVKTSPIPEVIERIENHGGRVVYPGTADIDQVGGTAEAYAAGFMRVAVTVADCQDAETIRRQFPETLIIGVHLTGVTKEEAGRLVDVCDIVSSCASVHIREQAGRRALLQGGVSIPVFALTDQGRNIILEKIRITEQTVLIRGMQLPYSGEHIPHPLI